VGPDNVWHKKAFMQRVQAERGIRAKSDLFVELCSGRDVLDVGCVGQNMNYDDPRWLHQKIRNSAASVLGVDIDRAGISELKSRGLDAIHADDLENSGSDFDLVVMSDVIEHVDDPVAFLRFYAAFLRENGRIVVTTPNPFSAIHLLRILRWNQVKVNPEHTMWIDPGVFTEIANRAELTLCDFLWISDYADLGAMGLGSRVMRHTASLMSRVRRYYSPYYMVALTR